MFFLGFCPFFSISDSRFRALLSEFRLINKYMSFKNLGSCSIARFLQKKSRKVFTGEFFLLESDTDLIKFTSVCILIFLVVEKPVFTVVIASGNLDGRICDFLASRLYRGRIVRPASLFIDKIIAFCIVKSCV